MKFQAWRDLLWRIRMQCCKKEESSFVLLCWWMPRTQMLHRKERCRSSNWILRLSTFLLSFTAIVYGVNWNEMAKTAMYWTFLEELLLNDQTNTRTVMSTFDRKIGNASMVPPTRHWRKHFFHGTCSDTGLSVCLWWGGRDDTATTSNQTCKEPMTVAVAITR